MKTGFTTLAAIIIAASSQATAAADTEHGKSLVKEHCTKCHDDGMYTRKDRKVTTLNGLQNQVRRCETNLELKWFEDDIDDVISYLNTQYYKFGESHDGM